MQTILGKYEVRSKIATGPTNVIYEGWDTIIRRRVAIKAVQLNQTTSDGSYDLARFRHEAQAAGRLQHPNIVAIFDYGETDECAYIVMEFVEGASLKAALDSGTRYPVTAIISLMHDILAALQYTHASGVIHRDIKPANIMLDTNGRAKIADFGIAHLRDSDLTQIGTIMGTPAYMSPEQFRGEAIGASTDIYSAGVILYQLLTGARPFEGGVATIMHKALNTEPPKPSDIAGTVPREADKVVARAMAKRPEDRFRTAEEFQASLAAALAARSPRPSVAPHQAKRAPRAAMIAGALALITTGGVTAITLLHRQAPTAAPRPTEPPARPPPTDIALPTPPPAPAPAPTEHAETPIAPVTPDYVEPAEPAPPIQAVAPETENPAFSTTPTPRPAAIILPPRPASHPAPAPRHDTRAQAAPRSGPASTEPDHAASDNPASAGRPPAPLSAQANNRRVKDVTTEAEPSAPHPPPPATASASATTERQDPTNGPQTPYGSFEVRDGQRVFVPFGSNSTH